MEREIAKIQKEWEVQEAEAAASAASRSAATLPHSPPLSTPRTRAN
eukprot:COSAG05_NODE_643_length_8130_cov_11.217781_6_plen_46_part_00